MFLLAIAVPVLLVARLLSRARQAAAADQEQALRQTAAGIPLVNAMKADNFVPPISIVITDSQGHTMRVVADEHGQQHPEPALNLDCANRKV